MTDPVPTIVFSIISQIQSLKKNNILAIIFTVSKIKCVWVNHIAAKPQSWERETLNKYINKQIKTNVNVAVRVTLLLKQNLSPTKSFYVVEKKENRTKIHPRPYLSHVSSQMSAC